MSGTTVFKLIQFNPRRFERGAEAARVEVNGEWFWMSRNDIEANIKAFGEHPELLKARQAYKTPRVAIELGSTT